MASAARHYCQVPSGMIEGNPAPSHENNTKGVVREWWMHTPTSYWFIAERNTETEEIIKTYPASEIFKQRVDFTQNKS